MRFPRRRSSPIPRSPESVYVVVSGSTVVQVFAHLEDAERFVAENPGARVSRHHIRRSVEEALVVFDRRVVVAQGATVLDRTEVTRHFVDELQGTPEPADVEWFHDPVDRVWHIAGFGFDKTVLDAAMQDAIDQVCRLSRASSLEGAR